MKIYLIDPWWSLIPAEGGLIFYVCSSQSQSQSKTVEAKFPDLTLRYMGEDMKLTITSSHLCLQPVKDIYTKSTMTMKFAGNGDMSYLKYFWIGIAALFYFIYCLD